MRCAKLQTHVLGTQNHLFMYTDTSVFGKSYIHSSDLSVTAYVQECELFHDFTLNYGGCIL